MNTETGFAEWAAPQAAAKVEYSVAVLAEIRDHVAEGVRQLTRGLEVGGVLYGEFADNADRPCVRVLAMRPITCEHASGPTLQFSENDAARLTEQLETDLKNSQLAGLSAVGWFVSHPRRDVAMQPYDVEIFNTFFPEPRQITLVVRPARGGSMRGGFFVREADGSLKGERSYQDFALPELALGNPVPPSNGAPNGQLNNRPAPTNFQRTPRARNGFAGMPGAPEGAGTPTRSSSSTIANSEAVEPAADSAFEFRSFGEPPLNPKPGIGSRRVSGFWLWLAAAACVGALAAVASVNVFKPKMASEPFALGVLDRNGQLQIQWNHASRTVTGASRGVIEIVDGTEHRTFPVTAQELAQGTYTYARKTGDVQVRMAISDSDGSQTLEASRFLGSNPDVPSPSIPTVAPAIAPPPPLVTDAARDLREKGLLDENGRQKARIQQLERTVVILQNRLNIPQ